MTRLLLRTRYFIRIPIIGLALAAIFFFVFGGIGLLGLLWGLAAGDTATHSSSDGGLGVFVALRAWSSKLNRESDAAADSASHKRPAEDESGGVSDGGLGQGSQESLGDERLS